MAVSARCMVFRLMPMYYHEAHNFQELQMNNQNTSMTPASNWTAAPNAPGKCRGLLALDGESLSPEHLEAAQTKCLLAVDRVDILLVNPYREPTAMLRELLCDLEQVGIDYRVTISTGTVSDQIKHYIRRFLGIRLIMLTIMPTLGKNWRIDAADLRHQGYRLMTMIDSPMI